MIEVAQDTVEWWVLANKKRNLGTVYDVKFVEQHQTTTTSTVSLPRCCNSDSIIRYHQINKATSESQKQGFLFIDCSCR